MDCERKSYYADVLTPSNSRESSRCRGITVTSSISHRKPTSFGVRPGSRRSAMSVCCCHALRPGNVVNAGESGSEGGTRDVVKFAFPYRPIRGAKRRTTA